MEQSNTTGGQAMIVLDEGCAHLLPRLNPITSTIVFQRSLGFRSSCRAAVQELRQLVFSPETSGRVVLVAPSFAGFTALLYAQAFPENIAGLLLVDPSHPRQGPMALAALDSPNAPDAPSIRAFRTMLAGFGEAWDEGCRDVAAITNLGQMRMIVLAAGKPLTPPELPASIREKLIRDRHDLLAEYARLSSRGEIRIVAGVGHDIARESPDVVIRAALELAAVG
jgi:pimeloyl-ACP methyl ester carboxylesterase